MVEGRKKESIDDLMKLLDPKRKLDVLVTKTFELLPKGFCIILVENMSNYNTINTRVAKYFVDKGMHGIYVTVNKNIDELVNALEQEKVNIEGIQFIDTVTKMASDNEREGPNFYYLDSPKDMLGLSVTVEKAMAAVKSKEKFLILDSLTTLLVYNKEGSVDKFVHSLASKVKAWNANGVFILMDTADKQTISTLAQFCDEVVKFRTT